MAYLYLVEKLRFPLLDELMLLITKFGEETAFLVAAMVVFWCVDKNRGYFVLAVGAFGTVITQVMKLFCQVPRPWIRDPNFPAVEAAKAEAGGFSFPSGHSQSAVGTFGAIACGTKNKAIRYILIAICILVPFSRNYLGVHYLSDVLVGTAVSLALLWLLRRMQDGRHIPLALTVLALCAAAYVLIVELCPFPQDTEHAVESYRSGFQNAYTLLGAILGILAVYWIDRKWVNFPVEAIWWAQIIKVAVGLGLVLAVKSGLKAPLNGLLGEYPGRAVRYFLMVIVAGGLWPMSFRWFSKLGKRESK